jgi:D-sedoheptulose 7-phosphate isomerase
MQAVHEAHRTVRLYLRHTIDVHQRVLDKCVDSIVSAAELLAATFTSRGKVLLCGNGGSAADCQHMAAEFVSRLSRDFERPGLPAIALTTDTSFLTAFANDYGYDNVFERQVRALGRAGDTLIGISTSGNSKNVVRAVEAARAIEMRIIALTGEDGLITRLADVAIAVPSSDTQHTQEAHLAVEHLLCYLVERQLFPRGTPGSPVGAERTPQ